MGIFGSLLFIVTFVCAMVMLVSVPKRKEKASLIEWIVITFVMLLGLWTFFAGLLNLIGVPFNLFMLSGINVVLAGAAMFYINVKRKTQRYYLSFKDLLVMIILFVITVIISVVRFKLRFDVFAYGSEDSARHFFYVKDIIEHQKFLTGSEVFHNRYVMYIIDVIFIKVFDPIVGITNWYRAYMLADLFMFYLMGATFWCWIRKYTKSTYAYILGVAFTVFYFLGYPLTNLLYGFEYLGAGVLSLTFLLWVLQKIEHKSLRAWSWILMLFAANTMVCLAYTQFAPGIIAGELIYLFIYLKRRKKLFSMITLLTVVVDFVLPGALCVSYIASRYWKILLPMLLILLLVLVLVVLVVYGVLFFIARKNNKGIDEVIEGIATFVASQKKARVIAGVIIGIIVAFVAYKFVYQGMMVRYTQTENGMYLDGTIYREPYANFVIMFFPLVLFVIESIKNRKNESVLWILLFTVLVSAWLLSSVVKGYVGSYYFYKMHFIVWTMIMGVGYQVFASLEGEMRSLAMTYLGTVLVFLVVALYGFDSRISAVNNWVWPSNTLESFYSVYINNFSMLKRGGDVSREMQEIYYKVEEISKREDTFIPYFGEELPYLKEYYYYLTDQDLEQHPGNLNNRDYPSFSIREDLEKLDIKYIFVQKNYNGPYKEYKHDFDIMWMEYENDYGWILKLD